MQDSSGSCPRGQRTSLGERSTTSGERERIFEQMCVCDLQCASVLSRVSTDNSRKMIRSKLEERSGVIFQLVAKPNVTEYKLLT